MKLLGSTRSKIKKDKNGENVPYLEIYEVVLIHCNVVNNSYQQNSRVLFVLAPNKSFGQLLDISPENFIFLKIFNSEFTYIEVWLTDQNFNCLADKIAYKISRVSKPSLQNNLETNEEKMLRGKNIYISPELKQKIFDDLRLKED